LMRLMGLEAIYPKPKWSLPGQGHKIFPYLLRDVKIDRVDQVWSTDITYVPMQHGFMYLAAVIDWYSRYVIAWRLSNTLDGSFCLELLDEALGQGRTGGVQY
jgi:putative transposase